MLIENTPLLETERLILRRFTPDDLDDVFSILGDEEVNTFLPWFVLENKEQAKKYLEENILAEYTKEIAYRYAVALTSDNRAIGYVNVGSIGESYDLGYGLRKEFWHRGIISEASMAVVKRLRQAGFSYITATHDVNNPNSGGVMKKIGMTYRYSYEELVQPKNYKVIFRMYQLDFKENVPVYEEYKNKYKNSFIEQNV